MQYGKRRPNNFIDLPDGSQIAPWLSGKWVVFWPNGTVAQDWSSAVRLGESRDVRLFDSPESAERFVVATLPSIYAEFDKDALSASEADWGCLGDAPC